MRDYYFNEPALHISIKNIFSPFATPQNKDKLNELKSISQLPIDQINTAFNNFTRTKTIIYKNDIYNFLYPQIKYASIYVKKLEHEQELLPYFVDNCKIKELVGTNFENFMSKFYYICNFDVENTKSSHDGGVDLILHPRNNFLITYYVQCKGSIIGKAVSASIIRDLNGTIHDAKVNAGFIATTTHVSTDSKKFIEQNNMLIHVHDFKFITDTLNDMFSL